MKHQIFVFLTLLFSLSSAKADDFQTAVALFASAFLLVPLRPGVTMQQFYSRRFNPFAPDVPCHRIISANGSLGDKKNKALSTKPIKEI